MSKATAFQGKGEYAGKWGVKDDGCILYEPDFTKAVAQRVAQLENWSEKRRPADWEATKKILITEGLLTESESSL